MFTLISSFGEFEKKVNAWLTEMGATIDIVNTNLTETDTEGQPRNLTYAILYKEKV